MLQANLRLCGPDGHRARSPQGQRSDGLRAAAHAAACSACSNGVAAEDFDPGTAIRPMALQAGHRRAFLEYMGPLQGEVPLPNNPFGASEIGDGIS